MLNTKVTIVYSETELNQAIANAKPGDIITMAKGNWKNLNLVFEANGIKDKPVIINAEVAGQTKLTGNSSIKFAGNFLVIDGLFITDGFAKDAVVEFRKDDKILANGCRLTNCVIENYSKPDRFEVDSWIILWGKNNRIDHCTIGDKLNGGTTLIVNLNDERSQQNYHSIDSNHFYLHSPLGSNGGETIRVGISRYSLTSSNTNIVHNYFEKCSGEVEIISVKSCYNAISQNVFYECEGGLVLRHGNHNTVEGNLFIGNNKIYTGGVRVINPNQTVTNNLLLNCVGVRFRSALGVLNGVPNSQLNRYFQVTDSKITNNSFINCSNITFGAGKDNERTAAPKNVLFANNFVYTKQNKLYEDLNNDGGMIIQSNTTNIIPNQKGFTTIKTKTIQWNGLSFEYPVTNNTGADLSKVGFIEKNKTGAYWYKPETKTTVKGKVIKVSISESKQLPSLIAKANSNDTLLLTDKGRYEIDNIINVSKPVSIIADSKVELVNVAEKSLSSFISIENGGSLYIKGIIFNSAYESYGDVQSAVASSKKNMVQHYTLKMVDCEFFNFNESNYSCYLANKSTFADSIVFENCLFRNMSGSAINLSSEKDDKGIYNAEYVIVRNCVFTNMLAGAINVYRGGNDESTTGPYVTIDHCVFNDVDNREQGCVIKLLGVQYARVINSIFNNSGKGGRTVWFEELSWDDVKVDNCDFYNAGRVQTFHGKLFGIHNLKVKPMFTDENKNNFSLHASSLLKTKASDGKNIGLQ
ncbi:MAG: TonB-dependent receptor [Chitinophaga sp.]|nr:TonB-dependent receptor [Chitinophaga sp.]